VCKCDHHCPDDHKNFTCTTDYKCFKSYEFEEDSINKVEKYGCMGNREGG